MPTANLILVRLWRFAVVINIRLDSTREEGEGNCAKDKYEYWSIYRINLGKRTAQDI